MYVGGYRTEEGGMECYTKFLIMCGVLMSICEKTTALIFLDLELVHHCIGRKLVIQS
jgi:hypothetical protein